MIGIRESTFHRWLQDSRENNSSSKVAFINRLGNIASCGVYRVRRRPYADVEEDLFNYIRKRALLYQQDKCGLSWMLMKEKARSIYSTLFPEADVNPNLPTLKASDGWIAKVLKRNDFVGVNLHGEANDISPS